MYTFQDNVLLNQSKYMSSVSSNPKTVYTNVLIFINQSVQGNFCYYWILFVSMLVMLIKYSVCRQWSL